MRYFFLAMGLLLTAIVLAGFIPTAFGRPGGVASMPMLLHLHGGVFFAWFVVFCTQARLAGTGNIRQHMNLGKLSVLLATAMVVLGYLVIDEALQRPDFSIAGMPAAASTIFPVTDILNFTIAYSLALFLRRTADAHKRLMLLAGILIIDPAAARLVMSLGGPAPMILLLELALFGALFAFDFKTRGRPHWASVLGLGLFAIALIAKFTVAQQSWWASFVYWFF